MNRLVPVAAALVLLGASSASAQSSGWTEYHPQQTLFTWGYQMSQPIGGLKDYVGSPSFRGFTFDWQSLVTKAIGVGVRFTWNRYNESYPLLTQTTTGGGTLSAPVFHFADQFAIEAVGHYFFNSGPDSTFLPFFGVGIGGVWSNSYQQTIDVSLSQDGFYFIVTPEVGLNIVLAKGSVNAELNLAFLYNFTTISFRDVSNAQSIAETIGLTFAY